MSGGKKSAARPHNKGSYERYRNEGVREKNKARRIAKEKAKQAKARLKKKRRLDSRAQEIETEEQSSS